MSKVVLVSGASSGLGRAVADRLSKEGYIVYAAARSYSGAAGSDEHGAFNLKKVYIDVTDIDSINGLIREIIDKEGRLDVLVNCQGYLVLGSVEDISIDEYKKVMDTNFYGTLNMCKAVLPFMRSQKSGKIVNFSSLNGVMGIPFESAYVSSKFAIEGLTECLSLETKKWNIKVVMIEPTDHRSGSKNYRPHALKADNPDSPYYDAFLIGTAKIASDEAGGSDPEGVGRLIHKIIKKENPRLRYTVGRFDQKLSNFLKKILPGRVFERIVLSYYKQ